VASVEEVNAGGVSARLYRPVGGELNVFIWLHGGAWMMGDVECYDAVARALANRAGCAVLSVDYRLAPEHRYPVPVDDCWVATEWAASQFDLVAVGGDSAGGNLGAAVALRARDRGLALALQLLVYPVLDYAAVDSPFYNDFRERYEEFAGATGIGAQHQEMIRYIWTIYVPDMSQRGQQDASPLQAASVAGVAPAVIITAEHDILRGEAGDYARRLQDEGVAVELHEYPGQVHGFFHLLGVMDDARDAVNKASEAIRRAFRDNT